MGNYYSTSDSNHIGTVASTDYNNYSAKYNWILSYPQKKIMYMTDDNLTTLSYFNFAIAVFGTIIYLYFQFFKKGNWY